MAAQQLVGYCRQVGDAANAAKKLARRRLAAGNFNKLSQLREQLRYADGTADLARAQQSAAASRERLTRLLALSVDRPAFTLPDRLPERPASPAAPQNVKQTAIDQRLDVLVAKRSVEATANDDRCRSPRSGQENHPPGARLQGHGRQGHERHGRDGNALPANTLPMMTGLGPFGPVGMGGMFSVVKVRDGRPEARRLQRLRARPAPGGHTGQRIHRPTRPARARRRTLGRPANPDGSQTLTVRNPGGHDGH